MGFLLTALALIAGAALFVLLGVGLALVLGLVLVVALIAVVVSLVFGGSSPLSFVQGLNKGADIPGHFNHCLLEEKVDDCRKKWTNWDEDKLDLVRQLAEQVQSDLGERGDSRSHNQSSQSLNGKTQVTLDLVTDFSKRKAVHEHYVLTNKNKELRIEELKWEY